MGFGYDAIGNLVKDSTAEIDTIYWSVSGNTKNIGRRPGSSLDSLVFDYDASGNRIAKHVFHSNHTFDNSTYYVRDAQGNILATYKLTDPGTPSLMLRERNIYGSSRVGINGDIVKMVHLTEKIKQVLSGYLGF